MMDESESDLANVIDRPSCLHIRLYGSVPGIDQGASTGFLVWGCALASRQHCSYASSKICHCRYIQSLITKACICTYTHTYTQSHDCHGHTHMLTLTELHPVCAGPESLWRRGCC